MVETKSNAAFINNSKTLVKKYAIILVLLAICVFLSFASKYFFTLENIINVLRQISVIAILATGVSFVIITGGIDLSLGSALGLGGVLVALFTKIGIPSWFSVVFTLGVGLLLGLMVGIIIEKAKINAFITTLGMMNIYRGASYLLTDGMPISFDTPASFLGEGRIGILPFPILLMFSIAILGQIFASKTVLGRNVFAVGDNSIAAKLSGIKTHRVKYFTHAICTCLCFFAGIITAGNLTTADPATGLGVELDAIAAAVIGGVSLSGGKGSIATVLIGAALMGVMRNGFVLLGVSAYWQIVAIGVIILLAVGIDSSGKNA